MRIRRSMGEKVFDAGNVAFLLLICATVLLPLLHVLAGAFSTSKALMCSEVLIWPVEFTFENMSKVMDNEIFWHAFGVSVIVVVLGTLLNLAITSLTAYPLSKSYLTGRKWLLLVILFTMIFQAPLIPTYLVVKSLGMLNTLWALIIPAAMSGFNTILCLTFFRNLPEELFEAAKVDGMSEYGILFKIALPLSKPIMVTLLLFYAVVHWNSYYMPLLYITDLKWRTLQMYLFNLISQGDMSTTGASGAEFTQITPQSIQLATIVVATIPIIIVYPFLQKHFIKGALIGSVKG
ncbi:carbohydrate ABC transporter permease [Paenibacillus sp. HB172176]|uniref:carbohydrate ABC transporter permease n=1 Tax=Paenibacillus sp. HB172176 TaxID=2493690 RepID=UPI001438834D|nr:carbohydrate ABC transporter permease [Paenibacillus sp. HB172176]